jgi:hypothetical protein
MELSSKLTQTTTLTLLLLMFRNQDSVLVILSFLNSINMESILERSTTSISQLVLTKLLTYTI